MYYDRVKEFAKKKGVSVRKIEIDLELSNGSISKWNTSMPGADKLEKVASYLGVSVSDFFKEEKEG